MICNCLIICIKFAAENFTNTNEYEKCNFIISYFLSHDDGSYGLGRHASVPQ